MSAQQQEQLNTESPPPARTTGYESIRDLGDCVRTLIPRGTECVLGLVGFTLNTEGGRGKERIDGKFEVLQPDEYEDYGVFNRSYYLGNTAKPGKRATDTAWHMSRREWCQIVAAIYQVPFSADDVRFFFADLAADPATDMIGFFEEVTAKLNSLTGQHFPTRIGVEVDKSGQYDPKQTIGKPLYPSEEEFARSGGGNGAA